MKQKLSAFAICALMLLGIPALAQTPQPFSADMAMTSSSGNVSMKGKYFMALPKMRVDMSDSGQRQGPFGGKMSIITDVTAKTAYMLMPESQMYMEFPLDENNTMAQRLPSLRDFNGDPCAVGREGATCKKIGTETINGRSCDKWEVTEKSSKKETLWMDQKLHFPIKVLSSDGMTSEFTNIKEGPQDPALFKVPAGYRKFDASMMGGQRPH